MSYLRHLQACNAHDPSLYRPFMVGGRRLGAIRHAFAETLAAFPDVFAVSAEAVVLSDRFADFELRSAAVAGVLRRLAEQGRLHPRNEDYAVLGRWGEAPALKLDRGAVPYFGIRSFGLHVNGFVRRPDGLHLWIGRRAADRLVAPGKLDNLIAGGQPYGLSLAENLVKEAREEAGLDAETAQRALPVGALSYRMDNGYGLKPDTLFVYDLELPDGFTPRNTDGEVERFELWPLEEVARAVRGTDDFKFNVNLVLIDFMIRHGFLGPEHPEYLDLALGLRRADL
ncbi:DUF4743 domain-containing protein [Arenibaculum pallidiluteum]|uniref:DUF4743 domain-containing protein n=1 Tax=Arenibaculum pallidiluteum TaxID=2812559 RepID=UPI001A961E68|nr:DUF4743 domain-containing protein [Arenibaculum pallidiluteum]